MHDKGIPKSCFLFAGAVGLVGAVAYLYASRIEARRYKLETVKVTVDRNGSRGLPLFPRPLRILHLSDLHLCEPESHKIAFLQKATDDDYDLVFLTGDVFENYSGLPYAEKILSRSPRLGAYAVLGNHDYYNYRMVHKIVGRVIRKFRHPREKRDIMPMVSALEKSGFRVMRNEVYRLHEHGLVIVGIDYPGISVELLQQHMSLAQSDDLILALFHLPRRLDNLVRAGIHLAVGGHTHGGQIRLPGLGAIITDSELPRHQASGVFQRGNTLFHISRGIGADPKTNVRLFCPPAATIIEVHT